MDNLPPSGIVYENGRVTMANVYMTVRESIELSQLWLESATVIAHMTDLERNRLLAYRRAYRAGYFSEHYKVLPLEDWSAPA